MPATIVIATVLVALAGFATQRGTICAVQAGRDAVERRSWARFLSFLGCAAWSALIFPIWRCRPPFRSVPKIALWNRSHR